jgi:hypothetical protein
MAARGKAFPALPATFTAQWGRYAIFQYFTVTKKSAKQNIKNNKRALEKNKFCINVFGSIVQCL